MWDKFKQYFIHKAAVPNSFWNTGSNIPTYYSYISAAGRETFFTERQARTLAAAKKAQSYHEYFSFVPRRLIEHISGDVFSPNKTKTDTLIAYIDGSFSRSEIYACIGFGVFLIAEHYTAEYGGAICDDRGLYSSSGAELLAAAAAVRIAIEHRYRSVVIYHDYTGVDCFGSYQYEREHSKCFNQYVDFIDAAKEYINISFCKVHAHSYDFGNEHANYIAQTYSRRERKHRFHVFASHSSEEAPNSQYLVHWCQVNQINADMATALNMLGEMNMQTRLKLSDDEYVVLIKMLSGCSMRRIQESTGISAKEIGALKESISQKLGFYPKADDCTISMKVFDILLHFEGF